IDDRRRPPAQTVGVGRAVADDEVSQLAFRRFDRMIDFAHRRLDDLGDLAHDRAFRNAVDGLFDDAHRLPHFHHADHVPVVRVAVFAGWNFEIELGVGRVGLGFAQVPFHAAGAQQRTGDAKRNAIAGRDYADILGALQPDAVGG